VLQTNNPYFIDYKEFAEFIGRDPRTIYNIITSRKPKDNQRKKEIPPFKQVAGKHIVLKKDFEKWLDELPIETTLVKSKRGRPRNLQPSTKF